MSEKIIYNPHSKKDINFEKQVNLMDKAIVNINGSVQEGHIELINLNGVNINFGYGGRFTKWCHVLAIKKKS
jgi:hypothetical protein